MPNPKLGTVTMDVKGAVENAKAGEVQFRVEKAGIVPWRCWQGQLCEQPKINENAKAFIDAIMKAKPTGAKGTYVKSVSLSSTMGPGLKDRCQRGLRGATRLASDINRCLSACSGG